MKTLRELQNDLRARMGEPPLTTKYDGAKSVKSVAIWPEGTLCYRADQRSDDENHNFECARAICQRLRREGFGGDRKIFPVEVFVEVTHADGKIEKVEL